MDWINFFLELFSLSLVGLNDKSRNFKFEIWLKIDFFCCHITNLNYIGYVKRNRLPTNCLQLPICINCYSLIFGRPTAETWHYRIIVLFRAMVCLVAGLRDIYTISMGNLGIIIVEFKKGSWYCIYLYIWYCFIFKTMHRKTKKKYN